MRSKHLTRKIASTAALTAVTFGATQHDIYVGGITNTIEKIDLRRDDILAPQKGEGHSDTITCLEYQVERNLLLSIGMDSVGYIWAAESSFESTSTDSLNTISSAVSLRGAPHGFDKNLIKGQFSPIYPHQVLLVSSGSSDRTATLWDLSSSLSVGRPPSSRSLPPSCAPIKYKLPGHKGTVNQVVFHPKEPIILSCSTDKSMILGEFEI